MRAIRNFIYNTSDILVALIILAVAVLLIWSRIDVIMGYPGDEAPSEPAVAETVETPDIEVTTEDGTVEEGAAEVNPGSGYEGPVDPENYIKVSIPNGSSNDVVAGLLKQAGVLSDTNDFINAIQNSEYNGAVIPGDHWIPKGADMTTVIRSLTIEGVPEQ